MNTILKNLINFGKDIPTYLQKIRMHNETHCPMLRQISASNQLSKAKGSKKCYKKLTEAKAICSHKGLIDDDYSNWSDNIEHPWCCINSRLLISFSSWRHFYLFLWNVTRSFTTQSSWKKLLYLNIKTNWFVCKEKISIWRHQKINEENV